jgi:VPDSG-CTERM motif
MNPILEYKRRKFGAILLLTIVVFGLQQAKADFISFLGSPNDALSGLSGPFGKVVVHLVDSDTATVTFTSLTKNGNIYLFGDGSTAAVNVNATSFSITGVSGSNAGTGFTPGPYTVQNPPGTSNISEFGDFNGVIDSFDGYTHSSDTVSFTLNNLSDTWSGANDVLAANADGFDAVAHIFVTSSPANAKGSASVTGFAGETGGPSTPDGGATAMLLGLGLSGLGFVRRFAGR